MLFRSKAVSTEIQRKEKKARTAATFKDFEAAFEVPTPTNKLPTSPEVKAELERLSEAKAAAEASVKAMDATGIYDPQKYQAAQQAAADAESQIARVSSEARGELPASQELQDILNTKIVRTAIGHIRANTADRELATLPDYHPRMLQHVLQDLSQRFGAAVTAEDRVNSRVIGELKGQLEEQLKTFNPLLLAAREKYANLSERINYLDESQIEVLSELAADNAEGAARTIFSKLSAPRIAKLRQEFVDSKNGPAWDSFVRGHLYNVFSSKAENLDSVRSLIKVPSMRSKIKAAIGEKGWEKLYRDLSDEALIHESKVGLAMGSQTEPRLSAGEAMAGAVLPASGIAGKLKSTARLWDIMAAEHPEDIRGAAEIFVDPRRSAYVLEKLAAVREAKGGPRSNLAAILQAQGQNQAQQIGGAVGSAVANALGPQAPQRTLAGTLSGAIQGFKQGLPEAAPAGGWLAGYAQSQDQGYNQPPTYGDLYPQTVEQNQAWAADTLDPIEQVPQVMRPLVQAIIDQESGGNAKAKSKAGALGLMQLMPGTAKMLGVDPLDPVQNVAGGTKYITDLMTKTGDVYLALASYNAGPGAVIEARKKAGWSKNWADYSKFLSEETQKYVPSVIAKAKKYKGSK